jgi:hypothetical protein
MMDRHKGWFDWEIPFAIFVFYLSLPLAGRVSKHLPYFPMSLFGNR